LRRGGKWIRGINIRYQERGKKEDQGGGSLVEVFDDSDKDKKMRVSKEKTC